MGDTGSRRPRRRTGPGVAPGGIRRIRPRPQAAPDTTRPAAPPARSLLRRGLTWAITGVAGGAVTALVAAFFLTRNSDVADQLATGAPMRVTVQLRDSLDDNGAWWFAKPIAAPGGSASRAQLAQLISSGRAVDTYETTALLTIQGLRGNPVVITEIRADIHSRTAPAPGGTVVVFPPQGLDDTINVGLDLDEPAPRARTVLDNGDFSTQYVFGLNHTVPLANGQVQSFGIKAMTTQSDVTYDLVIDAVVDGRLTHQVVTNGSQPFHTRAFATAYDQVLGWSTTDPSGWTTTSLRSATAALCDTMCRAPVPLRPPAPAPTR